MSEPRKRTVRRLMIDALALAETFDHETAPHCHDLIEAMDRAEGDTDFEPSLGSLNIRGHSQHVWPPNGKLITPLLLSRSSLSQENWAAGTRKDIELDPLDEGEHDPAELGELTDHGFQNEKPWETYTGILGGGLWNWRGERV